MIMKKIIFIALTTLMMVGCRYTKEETIKNLSVDGYILKEIDSCEYFMVHVSSYMDGGCYLPIHKNNCRFCKERRQRELKEIVEQIKER